MEAILGTKKVKNPYVGVRPFERGDVLYGREQETDEIINLLLAERIVLLYSPSGAGKTSLIQAKLIPQLENEFFVFPVISVHPQAVQIKDANTNPYLESMILSLLTESEKNSYSPNLEDAFVQFINKRSDPDKLKMLIFDQFEEILRVNPFDKPQKEAFFKTVGSFLRDRSYWALFSIREDYVGALKPYVRPIPTGLSVTFRLDLLDEESALAAIQEPIKVIGGVFEDAAAKSLVDDLRRVQVQQVDGSWKEELGLYVEPIQLQLVCQRLWEASADPKRIENVASTGTVNDALTEYYVSTVKQVSSELRITDRSIRDWFQNQLITEQKTRALLALNPQQSGGLRNDAIYRLVDSHLVRAERRHAAIWFELAHDRLIIPIWENNHEWYREHLNLLQLQAQLWEDRGRPDGLWLRGKPLRIMKQWAATNPRKLNETEHEFLDRSRHYERKRILRYSLIAFISIVFWIAYEYQYQQSLSRDTSKRLALQASKQKQLDSAILLGTEAFLNYDTPEARQAVFQTVGSASPFLEFLLYDGRQRLNLKLSRAKHLLASFSTDSNSVHIWNMNSPRDAPSIFQIGTGRIFSAAFNDDGTLLGIGTDQSELMIWDTQAKKIIANVKLEGRESVADLLFDDSTIIATTSRGVNIWNLKTRVVTPLSPYQQESITKIAIAPTSKVLACASPAKKIFLWDLQTGQQLRPPLETPESIFDIAFSPQGQYLVAVLAKNISEGADRVVLWNVDDFSENSMQLPVHASSLALSKKAIVIGTEDNTILLLNPFNLNKILTLRYHSSPVTYLAFTPDEEHLVSVSKADGRIAIWNPWKDVHRSEKGTEAFGHTDVVTALTFVPKHNELISGGRDGRILVTNIQDGTSQEFGRYNFLVTDLCLTPDGEILITSGKDEYEQSRIILWNMKTKKQIGDFKTAGDVQQIAAIPNGKKLITSNYDSNTYSIKIWQLPEGEMLKSFSIESVTDVAVSSDGNHAAAGTLNGKMFLWDIVSGAQKELSSDAGQVTAITFDPKSSLLAAASLDRDVQFWNLSKDSLLQSSAESRGALTLNFDSEGTHLIVGTKAESIIVFEVSSKDSPSGPVEYGLKPETILNNLGSPISKLAYNENQKQIAYAVGNSILLWKDDINEMLRQGCAIANRNLTQAEWQLYISGELKKGRWWNRYISNHEDYHDVCSDLK